MGHGSGRQRASAIEAGNDAKLSRKRLRRAQKAQGELKRDCAAAA